MKLKARQVCVVFLFPRWHKKRQDRPICVRKTAFIFVIMVQGQHVVAFNIFDGKLFFWLPNVLNYFLLF